LGLPQVHPSTKNLKYNIYYDPAYRNHKIPFQFIGLYRDGAIQTVGKVSKIVYCDYNNGKLEESYDEQDLGRLTSDEYNRIQAIIEETTYYDLKTDTKFFLVEKFHETLYSLDYAIRGKQYFWLNEIEGFEPGISAQKLAVLLRKSKLK